MTDSVPLPFSIRRFVRQLTGLVCLLASFSACSTAMMMRLSNPSVDVGLIHPPGIGLLPWRVVFAPSRGSCDDEVIADLTAALRAEGVEVAGRAAPIAAGESGAVGALSIAINVTRCDIAEDRRTRKFKRTRTEGKGKNERTVTENVTEFISETTLDFRMNLEVTDVETAALLATKHFAYSPSRENRSEKGYPEYPPSGTLRDQANARAGEDLQRMFLPWTEFRQLVFFDDERCGMQTAWLALNAGDTEGALRLSLANLEICGNDPEADAATLARVHHNAGMTHFLLDDPTSALSYFEEAVALQPGVAVFAEASMACAEAQELNDAMRQLEASQ